MSSDIYTILKSYKNQEINLETFTNLINSGDYDLNKLTTNDISPIIWACISDMSEAALALIQTGKSIIEQVNTIGDTALIMSCFRNMPEVALALIQTGKSIPEHVNQNSSTALIMACGKNMPEVAIALIQTGKSIPEQVNNTGNTALIFACEQKMSEVAIALIQTGNSRPEQVNKEGNTALIWACAKRMSEVALMLMQTGNSSPEQVSNTGNTALILACSNNMSEVAIALIQTDKSLPEQVSKNGDTALNIAKKKRLNEVVTLLIDILNKLRININANGFEQSSQETHKISDFLNESSDNICIKSNNSYFLSSKKIIKKTLIDKANIKYACKTAGDDQIIFTVESNILYNEKYLTLSPIIGLQVLVDYNEIVKIVNDKISSNLFYITSTEKKLTSIISQAYIDGLSGIGADHCGTGKQQTVYTISAAIPICGEVEATETVTTTQPNEIKIQYKGTVFSFPVTETDTLGEIKNVLLEKLMSENVISSINQNVKFIYKGKIYTDNSILLTSLENPPVGITLQSMVSPITGGRKNRKTRKKYRQKNNKKKTNKFTKNHKIYNK